MEITVTVKKLKPQYSITRVSPVVLVYSNQSLDDDDDFVVRSGYPYGVPDGSVGGPMSSYLILTERVRAGRVDDGGPPAFIHFPPVSTVSVQPHRDVTNYYRSASLGPRKLIVHKGRAHKFSYSIAYAYYGNRFNQIHQGSHVGYVGARKQFINLGNPGDGFYEATNYISWSCVLSLGSPHLKPSDSGTNAHMWAGLLIIGTLLVGSITAVAVWYRRRYIHWSTPDCETEQRNLPIVRTFRATFVRKTTDQTSARREDSLLIEPLLSTSLDSYNSTQYSEFL
ncbi:unnamed protein product [Dicrocoelium dendriticum]|nr:unnamed protein product [Dicrocoelium dendriticum]